MILEVDLQQRSEPQRQWPTDCFSTVLVVLKVMVQHLAVNGKRDGHYPHLLSGAQVAVVKAGLDSGPAHRTDPWLRSRNGHEARHQWLEKVKGLRHCQTRMPSLGATSASTIETISATCDATVTCGCSAMALAQA